MLGWRLSLECLDLWAQVLSMAVEISRSLWPNPGHLLCIPGGIHLLDACSPGHSNEQPCFSSTVPEALERLSPLCPCPHVVGHTAAWSIRAFPEDLFLCSGIKVSRPVPGLFAWTLFKEWMQMTLWPCLDEGLEPGVGGESLHQFFSYPPPKGPEMWVWGERLFRFTQLWPIWNPRRSVRRWVVDLWGQWEENTVVRAFPTLLSASAVVTLPQMQHCARWGLPWPNVCFPFCWWCFLVTSARGLAAELLLSCLELCALSFLISWGLFWPQKHRKQQQ